MGPIIFLLLTSLSIQSSLGQNQEPQNSTGSDQVSLTHYIVYRLKYVLALVAKVNYISPDS